MNPEDRIEIIFNHDNLIKPLFKEILSSGETLIMGGALRDYKDNGLKTLPRDIDIIVNTGVEVLSKILIPYKTVKNRFGGYKVLGDNIIVDIWCLKNTWAYTEKIINCSPDKYSERLQDTVFLNMDAIVYNISTHKWYDRIYTDAIKTNILDVVLIKNPQLSLNIVRSLLLREKYGMKISHVLEKIIIDYISSNKNYLQELMNAQTSHYGTEIMNTSKLQNEIANVLTGKYRANKLGLYLI